jgi:S-adenosylmethionine hydrolase
MNLEKFVLENQKILEMVKDKVPGRDDVDMYYGTLDYATARFNTILLRLSQDKILEVDNKSEVVDCHNAIQAFYSNVQRYRFWPKITRPFVKLILHGIGTRRIPKIKKLLEKINN